MTAPIRLVLADDHPYILKALEELFAAESDFEVVASCTDGESALAAVRRCQPDLLVLDLAMPRMDGLAVMRELHTKGPLVRIVILTAALDEEDVLEAIRLGVRGVVLKEMAPRLLLKCLRIVQAGGEWLEKNSVRLALEKLLRSETEAQTVPGALTAREIEIVRLVTEGLSNKVVARRLQISEGTVKVHLHRIFEKLRVTSRVSLARAAQDRGFL